jgi:hypothetical protein
MLLNDKKGTAPSDRSRGVNIVVQYHAADATLIN